MLAILSLVPLPFLNPACTCGSSRSVHVLLKPSLKDFEHNLLACEMNATVLYFEHSLALPVFGIGMTVDLFQSCGHSMIK